VPTIPRSKGRVASPEATEPNAPNLPSTTKRKILVIPLTSTGGFGETTLPCLQYFWMFWSEMRRFCNVLT
jgi:hypothetical protein